MHVRILRRIPNKDSLGYFVRSALHYAHSRLQDCPSCGGDQYLNVSRKALVTRLVRCEACRLLYRIPRDPDGLMAKHYQHDYVSGGLTTSTPTPEELEILVATDFKNSDKDFSQKIAVLAALGVAQGAQVLDFGASWGYGVHQLIKSGYRATGYEISAPRAAYGRERLSVTVHTSADELEHGYDAIFSSHVIEHFSDPSEALRMARNLLRPGGVFVAFTPNGSLRQIPDNVRAFEHHWGRLHPVHLDEEYLLGRLSGVPCLMTSRPYRRWNDLSDIRHWNRKMTRTCDLSHSELLTVFINDPSERPNAGTSL